MVDVLLTTVSVQTVAVLIWCGRGFWRSYPAWTAYSLLVMLQSWLMLWRASDISQSAGVWCLFSPLILLGQLDSSLELFLRLSQLYRRFQRDRWKWLVIPAMLGALLGLLLIRNQLAVPMDFYRGLFMAHAVVGTVCASILMIGWIASIPVRLPGNLRIHMLLLSIYLGASTLGYANYFLASNQQFIHDVLVLIPPVLMLAWSLVLRPDGEQESETESELPESTLEQILGSLKRLI